MVATWLRIEQRRQDVAHFKVAKSTPGLMTAAVVPSPVHVGQLGRERRSRKTAIRPDIMMEIRHMAQ
jgi:hypothetical protein